MELRPSRGSYLYLKVIETALADRIITNDEKMILHTLANSLRVTPNDASECMLIALGEIPSPFTEGHGFDKSHFGDASLYQEALISALDDAVINEDEWAILDNLRNLIQLQPDQHAMIEEAIRSVASDTEEGQNRIERLERFNVIHPYS